MIGYPHRSQSPATAANARKLGGARQLETGNFALLANAERDRLGWSGKRATAARG